MRDGSEPIAAGAQMLANTLRKLLGGTASIFELESSEVSGNREGRGGTRRTAL